MWQKNFRPASRVKISLCNPDCMCVLSIQATSWCLNFSGMRNFPNFIDGFQYLAKNIEAWFKTRYVVQNVSKHLSYLARPVIRDHVQLGKSSKSQTVTHYCEKQRMYESKFQGKTIFLWLPRNKT